MGIEKVDLWFSMSNSKNDLLRCEGVDIGQSVPLPPRLIPRRAGQEVVGKVMHGYNNGIYDYDAEAIAAGYSENDGLRDMYTGIPTLDGDRSQLINVRTCAVTGADDKTDLADLNRLAARFPFVEPALLWYPEKAAGKEDRFPSLGWIHDFIDKYEGTHAAIHLCGRTAFDEFMSGQGETPELISHFSRVQLNLKFEGMRDQLSDNDIDRIIAQVKLHPDIEFVIQYGKDDAELLRKFDGVSNIAVFFDTSAGRGELAHEYNPPISGRFCGYAGGLDPDNVAEELLKIQRVAPGALIWIDAETGLRTDDRKSFDIAKVRRFCSIVEKFVPVEYSRVHATGTTPHLFRPEVIQGP